MINNYENIKIILIEISELLIKTGYLDWGSSFIKFKEEIDGNPKFVKNELLKLYGGMGSFNDIVLHKDKKLLIDENEQLDFLRNSLYKLISY